MSAATASSTTNTPTAFLFWGKMLPLPPGIFEKFGGADADLEMLHGENGGIRFGLLPDGGPRPGAVIRHLRGRYIHLNEEELKTAGWIHGQVVEFIDEGDMVIARPINGRDHIGFTNPTFDSDGLPIPPSWLVQAFTSNTDVAANLDDGYQTAQRIEELCLQYGPKLGAGMKILDFGCGCARVSRNFPKLTGASVVGSDLHEAAIEWCQRHMPHGTFLQGAETPPMELPSNSVDVMFALSVLTHLDQDLEGAWLAEWKRLLKPGGLAIVTYHGEAFIDKTIAKNAPRLTEIEDMWKTHNGIAFCNDGAWDGVFPGTYQTTYHREDYLRRVWGEHFEILDLLPSGSFVNSQDVAILRA